MPKAKLQSTDVVHPPQRRMSYEEFLKWLDEDVWAEWVNGEVIVLSPASFKHQRVKGFLFQLLSYFVEVHDLGVVIDAPFQMKLSKIGRGREPDILFVAKENMNRISENYLDGPADLIVEIVSSESILCDRGTKYAEYEFEGVREYWIIDPDQKRADFFVLGADGRYERRYPDGAIYRSTVLQGFQLDVNWLWSDPLPKVREILSKLRI